MTIRMAEWNVGTMRGRDGEVVEVMERRGVDICCIQEHMREREGARFITGKRKRYKFYWTKSDKTTRGTGVLVKEEWIGNVKNVIRVNDRIMVMKLMFGKIRVSVVSAYAPQVGRSEAIKDEFWDDLIRVVAGLPEEEMVILGGDLNGHVGADATRYEGVHGGYGYGQRNTAGETILEFGVAMDMIVCNTWFKKAKNKLITYEQKRTIQTQIDYFMVRRKDRNFVKDVKVIPNEECVKQHKLLVCDLRLKKWKVKRQMKKPRRKVWKLRKQDMKEAFSNEFRRLTEENGKTNESVNEQYEAIKRNLLKATDSVCGWTKGGPPRPNVTWWWNEIVEAAVNEKKRLYKEYKKGGNYEVYQEARRRSRKAVYEAKKEAIKPLLESLNGVDGQEKVFEMARQVKNESKDIVGEQCVRDDNGRIMINNEEIKKAWREHYNRLLNVEYEWNRRDLEVLEPVAGPWPCIERETVDRAIGKMKLGKAPGVSELTAEMLKASGELGVALVTDLINAIINESFIPEDWQRSVVVNIYKGKGDAMERGNYRGIKLLDQVMKVMERVIEGMIRERVKIDDMQFGFIQGRGTTDAIFVVRQLQEKYLAKGKKLYYIFVDLEKAFDRVPREVVTWAMRKLGVEEWLIKVVMVMYEDARTQVRVNGELSDDFTVNVGVHQGSVLSPLLFIIILEALSQDFRVGLPWEMLYADDLVLIAEDEQSAEEKFSKWKEGMESKGLRVNLKKTKVMISRVKDEEDRMEGTYPCPVCYSGVGNTSAIQCNGCYLWVHRRCSGIEGRLINDGTFECKVCRGVVTREPRQESIVLAGETFECVEEFSYLGDVISAGGGAKGSAVSRVRKGWMKFRELLPLLTMRGFSLKQKGRLYATCVRSVMLYGSETWAVKVDDTRRLERTEMRMVRWMCGASLNPQREGNRIPSEELRRRLGIECISDVMRRGRLSWFGHLERMNENSQVEKVRNMVVDGPFCRNAPRKTWNSVISDDLKKLKLNPRTAKDRNAWNAAIR